LAVGLAAAVARAVAAAAVTVAEEVAEMEKAKPNSRRAAHPPQTSAS